MELTGQAARRRPPHEADARFDDGGFVMVALLVGMAVAAVWMTAALPSWRHQVQREKEAELIFRGEAIARAIYLYRQENGQNLPPNLDVLVSRRYLRKKYIDPITGKDFVPVAGVTSGGGFGGPGTQGIVGVRSTSQDRSIRVYGGQEQYSLWAFDFSLEQQRSGGGGPMMDGPAPINPGRGREGGRFGGTPGAGGPGRGMRQGGAGPQGGAGGGFGGGRRGGG